MPLFSLRFPPASIAALVLFLIVAPLHAETLRLYVTPAIGQALATVLPALTQAGVDARIEGEASSATAIGLLAEGRADAAFTVRPLTGKDRAMAPEKLFVEVPIGVQATAVMVSRDVWEGGVRVLSKEQLRQIYEGEVTDWKKLGGAERAIKFFPYERGQGIWEQMAQWIYGEISRAPLGKSDVVVSGEDARNAVEFNGGSVSLAAPSWCDGKEVFALALRDDTGTAIEPTRPHLLDRTYPLARPVLVVFADKPTGARLRLRDFLLSEKCQQILAQSGLVPVSEPAAK